MTDTISVKHVQNIYDGVRFDNIVLTLNGESFDRTLDPFALIVSANFKKSLQQIITCSCGVSECAGVYDGVTVKCRRYTVEWRDIDCDLPKRFYRFKLENYLECVAQTRQYLIEICKFRETLVYKFTDEHHDGIYCDGLIENEARIASYMRYIRKYQSHVIQINRSLV